MARRQAASPARKRERQRAVRHALAGFVLGLLAVVTGFAFAGTGAESGPLSDAARTAATSAAVQIAVDPAARPRALTAPVVATTPEPFVPAAQRDLLMRPSATRVVVRAVGIDTQVATVGYSYTNGNLDYDVPRQAAGHYVGTAEPGDRGNLVIGGHVSMRTGPAVFQALPGVKAGDVVEVYRGDQVYRYSVTEIRVVAADATNVMRQTQDATLTLITCFPERNFQQRLVVIGKLV